MANDKDFILNNAIEIGGSTKVTVGDAPASGSVTVGYADMSTWVYDSVSFDTASQGGPFGIVFKSDGTKMYVLSGYTPDSIYQYSLSTAWDISTASYDSVSLNVSSQDADMYYLAVSSDGASFYVIGDSGNNVYQYNLSTAWDLSTASYSQSFNVSSQDSAPRAFEFNPSGTKMYVVGDTNKTIYQYSLSTSYDISSASYDSVSFSVSSEGHTSPSGLSFNSDGTKMYVVSSSADKVSEYALSTAYDISSASYSNSDFSLSGQDTNPYAIYFKPDGTKMYMAGATNTDIFQYTTGSTVATETFDTSTGNYFTHTPSADAEYGFSNAGDVQTFQLEVTGNQAVVGYDFANIASDSKTITISASTDSEALAFKPDGTVLYILSRQNSDTVRQYSLATAWDISTANTTATASKSVSEETEPQGMFFRPDGLKMYIIGHSTDTVREYPLTTAWDLSTAGSVSASKAVGISAPYGLTFKPDGTKFFVNDSNNLYEFSMSTAWDIANATSVATSPGLNTSGGSTGNYDHVWNEDGTKFITASDGANSLYEYTLSTAWDVSSFSGTASAFAVPDGSTAVVYGNSGRKLYVNVSGSAIINQYSTASTTPITITWDADIQWAGGTAPDSPAANEKDLYTITTDDGGTTYVGVQSGDNFS